MDCFYIIEGQEIKALNLNSREDSTIQILKSSLNQLNEDDLQNIINKIQDKSEIEILDLKDVIAIEDLIGNTSLHDLIKNQQSEFNSYKETLNFLYKLVSKIPGINLHKNNVLIGSFQNSDELISQYDPEKDVFIININDTLSESKLNIIKSLYDFLILKSSDIRNELGITLENEKLYIEKIFTNPENHLPEIEKLTKIIPLDENLIKNFKEINKNKSSKNILYHVQTITNASQLYTKYKSQINLDNFYDETKISDEEFSIITEENTKTEVDHLSKFFQEEISMGDLILLDIGQVEKFSKGEVKIDPEDKFNERKNHYPTGKRYIFYKRFNDEKTKQFGVELIDPKTGKLEKFLYKDLRLLWFDDVEDLYNNNGNRKYVLKDNTHKYKIKFQKWHPDFEEFSQDLEKKGGEFLNIQNFRNTHTHFVKIKENKKDENSNISNRYIQLDASVSNILKEGDIFKQNGVYYYIEKEYPDQFIVSFKDESKKLHSKSIRKSSLKPTEIRFSNENFKKLPKVQDVLGAEHGGYTKSIIEGANDPKLKIIQSGDIIHWESNDKEYYALVLGVHKNENGKVFIKAMTSKSNHFFTIEKDTIPNEQLEKGELQSISYGDTTKIKEVFTLNTKDFISIVNGVKNQVKDLSEIKTNPIIYSTFHKNTHNYTKVKLHKNKSILTQYIQKGDFIKDKNGKLWGVLSVENGFFNCVDENSDRNFIQVNQIDTFYIKHNSKLNNELAAYNTIHLNQVLISTVKPFGDKSGEEVIAIVPKNALTTEYLDNAIYIRPEKLNSNQYENYKQVEPENLKLLNSKFTETSKLYRYRKNGVLKLRTADNLSIKVTNKQDHDYTDLLKNLKRGMYVRFNFGTNSIDSFKFYRILEVTNDGYYLSFSSRTQQKTEVSEVFFMEKSEFESKLKEVQVNEKYGFTKYLKPKRLSEIEVKNDHKNKSNLLIYYAIKNIVENYFNIKVEELSEDEIRKKYGHEDKNIQGFLTTEKGSAKMVINKNLKSSKGQVMLHEFMHIILGVQKIKYPENYYKIIKPFKTESNTDLEAEEELIETFTNPEYLKDLKFDGTDYGNIFSSFINQFFESINKSGISQDYLAATRSIKGIFNTLASDFISLKDIETIYNKYDCHSSVALEFYKSQIKNLNINCK